MEREVMTLDVIIAGRLATIDQPGSYCWTCRLGAHTASDLAIRDADLPTPNGERTSS
jgi:hypothetical protein